MIVVVEYAGICIGIVGLIMLYIYSVSPNIKKGSATYLYTHEELKKIKKKEEEAEKHFKRMNTTGFILTLLSMLIAFWVRVLK